MPERKQMPLAPEDLPGYWPWGKPLPPGLLDGLTGTDQAVGLPAVLAAIRLLSHAVGQMPLLVFRESADGVRERATDAWQYELLHRGRGSERTPFNLRADIAAQLAGFGNAYLRKIKSTDGRVLDLVPLDPRLVKPERKHGEIVFRDSTSGKPVERDRSEIIFIRTFAYGGELAGVSPVTACRRAIHAALLRQRTEEKFLQNDARPPAVISFPVEVKESQAQRWIEAWEEQHKGPRNAGRIGVIGGGAELKSLPLSELDALFVQAVQLSAKQIASLFSIPAQLLIPGERFMPDEVARLLFTIHAVGPLVTGIDQALSADEDLFPRGSDLWAETLTDGLLKMDPLSKANVLVRYRQAGVFTANELRRLENLPPLPGGDELQQVPVGGAPNRNKPNASGNGGD